MTNKGLVPVVALALALGGCPRPGAVHVYLGPPGTSETHVLVEVRPGGVTAPVWRLRSVVVVEDVTRATLLPEPPPERPVDLPTTYAVVLPGRTGTVTVSVDALADTGEPVGRARGTVDLMPQQGVQVALTLSRPCVDGDTCQDGTFCNGVERCVDGMCFPGSQACPPSPFACVEVSCDEPAGSCAVGVDHGQCVGLGTGDWYCDPQVGCARGQPGAPFLQGTPLLEPGVATAGTQLNLAFVVSEPLGADPVVTMESGSQPVRFAVEESRTNREARQYAYTYHLLGTEQEGRREVRVDLVDLSGTTAQGLFAGIVLVDLAVPLVTGHKVEPRALRRDATAVLTLVLSEETRHPPAVSMTPVSGGTPLAWDGALAASTTWVFQFTARADHDPGAYHLGVAATDVAGNVLPNTSLGTVLLDYAAPEVLSSLVAPRLARPGAVVTVTVDVSEPAVGILPPTAQAAGGAALGFSLDVVTGTSLGFSHPVRRGEDGLYALELPPLRDEAGNLSPSTPLGSLRVDGTPPALLSYQQDATSLRGGDVLSVVVVLDEPLRQPPAVHLGPAPMTLVDALDQHRGGTFELDVATSLLSGTYLVEVNAEDEAGNTLLVRPGPLTAVDALAPDVVDLVFSPPMAALNTVAVLSLTVTEPLVTAPVLRWGAPLGDPGFAFTSSTGRVHSYRLEVTGAVVPGLYGLAFVDLVDVAGNLARRVVAERFAVAFTVDNRPPAITRAQTDADRYSALPGHDVVSLSVDVSEPLDGPGAYLAATMEGRPMTCQVLGDDPQRHLCTIPVTPGMAEGLHSIDVVARDAAGNLGYTNSRALLDFSAPGLSFTRAAPTRAKLNDTLSYTVTATEPLGGVPQLVLGGAGALAFTHVRGSAYVFEHLATSADRDGVYTVTVTMEDVVGNRAEGLLASSFSLDVTPPRVVDLRTDRVRYRHGDTVRVTFDLSERIDLGGGVLAVSLSGTALACTPYRLASPHHSCSTVVGASLPEGSHLLTVSARDGAGNDGFGSTWLTLDATPPDLLPGSVALALTPPAGCPLVQVTALSHGATARVGLTVTEPLLATPRLFAPTAGVPDFSVEVEAGVTYSFHLELSPSPSLVQGRHALHLAMTDQAGNERVVSLPDDVSLVVDTVAPAPLTAEQAGTLLYRRTPWGSSRTDGAAAFEVEGTGGPVAEPGATLLFWDRAETAEALEVGRVLVDGQGAVASARLNNADRDRTYVTQVDGACNPDGPTATLLRSVEWVATLGRRQPGQDDTNPHRLESRPWHTAGAQAVTTASAGVVDVAGTALALPDGLSTTVRGAGLGYVLAPRAHPPGTSRHALAYNSLAQRVVLFGGCRGTPWHEFINPTGETWELTGEGWYKVDLADREDDGHPSPRGNLAVVYDARRDRLVAFGGGLLSGASGETWEYAQGSWALVVPADPEGDGNPPGRASHAMAYDEHRGVTVLLGGCPVRDDYGCYPGELEGTWAWDGASWTRVHPGPGGPPRRSRHAMAYDRNRRVTVASGGVQNGPPFAVLSDVWEWDGSAWTQRGAGGGLGRHRSHTLTYDPSRQSVVLFGGTDGSGSIQNRLWSWSGSAWSPITPTPGPDGLPSARVQHGVTYDTARQGLVLFGGYNVSTRLDDSWLFRSGTWHRLAVPRPTSSPPGVILTSMAHDEGRGVTVLFGGSANTARSNDTWEWDGAQWSLLNPTLLPEGLPSKRYTHTLTYDPGRMATLVYGGTVMVDSCTEGDCQRVWAYASPSWHRLTPTASGPVNVINQAMAFDRARGQLVVLPNCTGTNGCSPATWLWSSQDGTWTQREPASFPDGVHPPNRTAPAMGHDESRGVVVVYGGVANEPRPRTVYEFDGVTWVAKTPLDGVEPSDNWGQFHFDPDTGSLVLVGMSRTRVAAAGIPHWRWDGERWQPVVVAGLPVSLVAPVRAGSVAYDRTRNRMVLFGGVDSAGVTRDDTWLGLSGAGTRPAGVFRVDLSGLPLRDATVGAVEAVVVAGGRGSGTPGVTLAAWRAGAWEDVDTAPADVGAPAWLTWASQGPGALDLLESGQALYVAVTTTREGGQAGAELALDYAEFKLRYRIR
jgi:hypothetical protein